MFLKIGNVFAVTAFLQAVGGSALYESYACNITGFNNENLGIYGGHKVNIRNAPYIAAIYYEDSDSMEYVPFCGGSIVHERFVLTAAHCLYMINLIFPGRSKRVFIGSSLADGKGKFIDVAKELCHEGFEITDQIPDDICLLKLKKPIKFGRKVAKINLPSEDFELSEGMMVNITGFGNIGVKDNKNKQLRQTTIPIVSDECCQELYPEVNDTQFCAGSRGHDSCKGDSGGPLTYNDVQVGVISYGETCTRSQAGVYTRISSYLDWINSSIEKNL